jgi:hypothetical protein
LADETINRVARRPPEIIGSYVGDPEPYFHRVGHHIHLEYLRRKLEGAELPPKFQSRTAEDDEESMHA